MNMKASNLLIASAILLIFAVTARADLNIYDGGASGEYFNPERDLEGFFVEVVQHDDGRVIVVTWYTYDLGRQMWLAGSAPLEDGAEFVEVPMEVFSGTDFGDAFATGEVRRDDWGTLVFSFPDCATANVEYDSELDFGQGAISLIRLTNLVGVTCTDA
jgi:hypothetical protein